MRLTVTLAGFTLLAATTAYAGAPRTYQVTGPVLEVKDNVVVIQKGKEKWEIVKDKDTKTTGNLKAGSKATVSYTMKAATIDVKGDVKKK